MDLLAPNRIENWVPDKKRVDSHTEDSVTLTDLDNTTTVNPLDPADPSFIEESALLEAISVVKDLSVINIENKDLELDILNPAKAKADIVIAVLNDLRTLIQQVYTNNQISKSFENKNVLSSFRINQSINLIEFTTKALEFVERFKTKNLLRIKNNVPSYNVLLYLGYSNLLEELPYPAEIYYTEESLRQAASEEVIADNAIKMYNKVNNNLEDNDLLDYSYRGALSAINKSKDSLYELIAFTVKSNIDLNKRFSKLEEMYSIAEKIESLNTVK